jgi:hypothetical protein
MKNLKIAFYTMLSVMPTLLYAQEKVTGQVFNKANEPIVGASVLLLEGEGNPTDKSGKFELNANSERSSCHLLGIRLVEFHWMEQQI